MSPRFPSFLVSFSFASFLLLACGSDASITPTPGNTDVSPTNPGPSPGTTPTASTPAGSPPATATPATASDCAALASAYCDKAKACNLQFEKMLGPSCGERIAALCKGRIAAPGTGMTQAAVTECRQSITKLACDAAFTERGPAGCAVKGSLAVDAPCAFDEQCESANCSANEGSCGKCEKALPAKPVTPTAGIGQACDNAGQTAPRCNVALGLWCDVASKKCAPIPLATIGQPCGFVGGSLVVCSAGATCRYVEDGGEGTCLAEKAIGDACAPDENECAIGTSCVKGQCGYPTADVCK